MANKKKITGGILIIAILLLIVAQGMTAIPGGHNPQIKTDNLVQGQVNSNGVLWIVGYVSPTGSHYPAPYKSFHANNLSITIYSPMAKSTYANFTVQSQTSIANSNRTNTEYENQSFFIKPRTVETLNLKIPFSSEKQKISLTYDNNTVVYYIQTYKPVNFPFGNNPLGLLAMVGIIMLAFTGINIGVSIFIINKAKYWPKMSTRIWLGMIILMGIIIYSITTNYYYDLTGYDWGIWLIPLYIINLFLILNAWEGKTQEELLIHIHETSSKNIETGIYSIHTAELTEKEQGKYPIENPSGKEYIDIHSYKDFFARLILDRRIPINMDIAEFPDELQNIKSGKIPEIRKRREKELLKLSEKIGNNEIIQNIDKKINWIMKDRKSKEHPYAEAYLIDPLAEKPAIVKRQMPKRKWAIHILKRNDQPPDDEDIKNIEKTKKFWCMESRLNGHHMRQAEEFLADYIAVSESGKKIHELSRLLAKNKAELNTKAYNWQTEIVEWIGEAQEEYKELEGKKDEIPRAEVEKENKENKEKEAKKDE